MQPTDNPPPYSPPVYQNPPTAPVIIKPPSIFGPSPMQLTCSNCHQQVTSSTAFQLGSCTFIAAITIFIFCFPCFWIPLVINTCKDVHHTCPSCNALLGTYKVL